MGAERLGATPRGREPAWRAAVCALALAGSCAAAPTDEVLQNWFDDPFFQVSSDIADCPLPAGPYMTEAERRVQTHHRAEKGTTCWLSGACDRPNVYAYDADIARALRDAAARSQPFTGTTLWVTVQGRVVYLEGCVASDAAVAPLEAFARQVPQVQQAVAIVRAPYRLRAPAPPP